MRHFIRRISVIRLQYAQRLLLYSFFIPTVFFWLLAQLVGEWVWPLDTLNQFQTQFIFVFLLFAFIFNLAGRPTGMHVSTLVLAFILMQVLPLYTKQPKPPCPPESCKAEALRIVQYNVYFQNRNLAGILKWATEISKTTDILVFHEIPVQWQRPLHKLKAVYPYMVITDNAAPYDMAVFSHIPLSQIESWGDGGVVRSVAIRVHGATPAVGLPFQLYGVHVASPVSQVSWENRNEALRFHGWQLRDYVQPNQIFLGDLNTTYFSAWYRRLLRTTGLKDAQLGFGLMPTWSFFFKTNLFNGLQIDHMLVSPEIYIEDRHTLGDYGSDHLPVYTKLWLYK